MGIVLTQQQLGRIAPGLGLQQPAFNVAVAKWGIDVSARSLAYFLAQAAHESQGFTRWTEDTNYTHADRLHAVFPHLFPTVESALPYVNKPQALANRVYANEYGNGDEASGHGWMYRGRGPLGLTFLDNYLDASTANYGDDRLIHTPDMVATPLPGWLVAAWFWHRQGCQPHADAGDFKGVTHKINPAMEGEAEREHWLSVISPIIGA